VLASDQKEPNGPVTVMVAPITHRKPDDKFSAVEISTEDAAALKLDDTTSWVIVDDVNYFTWVGPDVDTDHQTGNYEVGFLAPTLFSKITQKFQELNRLGRLRAVGRDDRKPVSSAKGS
jgi:hypothetical protein